MNNPVNNEQQTIQTLKNAFKSPNTAMAASLINSTRAQHPVLYNRALSQFNNEQRQAGRPASVHQPVAVPGAVAPVAAAVSATVNTGQQTAAPQASEIPSDLDEDMDEMESLEEEALPADGPSFDEFDEQIVEEENMIEDADEESIDDEDDAAPALLEEDDFEDDDEDDPVFEHETADSEFVYATAAPSEPIPTIEHLSYSHNLSLSIYLNTFEGDQYEIDGKFYTSKQPLRRGKGLEKDAIGSVRNSLENFIEGVRLEGEGVRLGVAVTDDVVDQYIAEQNHGIETRLKETFSEDSTAVVSVTSQAVATESPWGSDARRIVRNINLSFPIPAIVTTGRKKKDELKMLGSNLKIVNSLVRQLKENANVENVQVNILIEDAVLGDMINVFNSLVSEGQPVLFDRGYARFVVQAEDSLGGEVED